MVKELQTLQFYTRKHDKLPTMKEIGHHCVTWADRKANRVVWEMEENHGDFVSLSGKR